MILKNLYVFGAALVLSGCATCPTDSGAPRLWVKTPTLVTARVDTFVDIGPFLDFPDRFVGYHSMGLVTEGSVGWKSVYIQFQGLPILNGKRIELGQRLRFTLPVTKQGDCCGPYLNDITDAQFLPPKGG